MLYQKITKALKRIVFLPKTNHKPYPVILYEFLNWIIANRGGINVYFDYELYLKGKDVSEFILKRHYLKIDREINSTEYYSLLEDKYFFQEIISCHGFLMPNTVFLIDNSLIFSYETNTFVPIEELLKKNLDGFCKVINGFGGKMIYRIEILNKQLKINGKDITTSDFFKLLGKNKFLIQERIIQHERMNSLNPSCINTMRIITIKTGSTVHLFNVFLRIGINGNYVDNGLRGNIIVGVNKDSGKLMEHAYTPDVDKFRIIRHPETNIVFNEFIIPYYNEAIEMAKSLHLLFQQFFIIGWDIGITPKGPIVIEGNQVSDPYPIQLLYGGIKSSLLDYTKQYQKIS